MAEDSRQERFDKLNTDNSITHNTRWGDKVVQLAAPAGATCHSFSSCCHLKPALRYFCISFSSLDKYLGTLLRHMSDQNATTACSRPFIVWNSEPRNILVALQGIFYTSYRLCPVSV